MVRKLLFLTFFCLAGAAHAQAQEITQEEYSRLYSMAAPEEDGNALCKDLTEYPECVAEASMFRYYAWPDKGPEADTAYNRKTWIQYKFVSAHSLLNKEIPSSYKNRWLAGDRAVIISELLCRDMSGCGKFSTITKRRKDLVMRCPDSTCMPRGNVIDAKTGKTCPFVAIVRKNADDKSWRLISRFASDQKTSCSQDLMKLIPVSDLPW